MINPQMEGEKFTAPFVNKQLKKCKMKRVRINKQKIGLVYRNGDFLKVLLAGSHWLRFSDDVKLYDQSRLYVAISDMEIVMENDLFKNNAVQVNIKENEIALIYIRENFSILLRSGNYFYFKGSIDIKVEVCDLNSVDEISSIDQAILKNNSVSHLVTTFKLESYEKEFCSKMVNSLKNYLTEAFHSGMEFTPLN
jgi:hypothetical protein